MTASQFVEALVEAPGLPNLFNPYRDICSVHDTPDSPFIRQRNFVQYLNSHLQRKSQDLWIAEAPSYRGSRRTGMPFVPEYCLEMMADRLNTKTFKKATHTPMQMPTSVKLFWQIFNELEELPITYNALPLHPHQPNYPLSNRTPTKRELTQHLPYLEMLIELFQPKNIIVFGRKAEYACSKLGLHPVYVRHPSQGGQKAFLEKMTSLYNLKAA